MEVQLFRTLREHVLQLKFSNVGFSNWIHRTDAVAALLDQWAIEEEQELGSPRKNWDRGWWYYAESENVEDEKTEAKSR